MAGQAYDNARAEQSLLEIAVESWRFSRLFGKLASKLDAGESGRHLKQLRYFQKKREEILGSSGLTLVNVEGQPYDPGMAASALNLGDFGPDNVMPSAIFIDRRGNKCVGARAYSNATRNPDNAAVLFKRLMGTGTRMQLPGLLGWPLFSGFHRHCEDFPYDFSEKKAAERESGLSIAYMGTSPIADGHQDPGLQPPSGPEGEAGDRQEPPLQPAGPMKRRQDPALAAPRP
ncbi:hypothetical protein [Acidovorax sp.]|uniref:hypothetical protein n=1 Tax=Acidovorax sp. TaxID=1872122 RepID=UPI00391F91FA